MERMEEIILECLKIEKSFGFKKVLNGVDLKFFSKKITLLLGENGAGKTTLCKILSLLSQQNNGKLFYKGKSVVERTKNEYKKVLGYLSHQPFVYNHLTAIENLMFFAKLYGISNKKEKVEYLLKQFKLYDYKNEIAGKYSRGLQQRLSLCKVFLNDPSILILDEPFTGLDQKATMELSKILFDYKREERIILIVTHEIDETVEIADNFIILKDGKILVDSVFKSKEQLKNVYYDSFF